MLCYTADSNSWEMFNVWLPVSQEKIYHLLHIVNGENTIHDKKFFFTVSKLSLGDTWNIFCLVMLSVCQNFSCTAY